MSTVFTAARPVPHHPVSTLTSRPPDLLGGPMWLFRLRAIAVAGQLATLATLLAVGAMADLSIGPLLGVVCVIVVSNIPLYLLRNRADLHGRRLTRPFLLLDTLLLTALLAVSGGPTNPITIFYLVDVVMAAVLLGGAWTWGFVVLSSACYAGLFLFMPVLPRDVRGNTFAGHLYGMLFAFVSASACTAYSIWLVQRERRRAESRAEEARDIATRAESFASLTAVAAGAAHELATPLGTIAVAARELERAAAGATTTDEWAADARLIREEVDRCSAILEALSPPYPKGDEPAPFSPAELLAELQARLGTSARRRVHVRKATGASVRLPRERTAQAAAALLQNALDSGDERVTVSCCADRDELRFDVEDRGRGIPLQIQSRLGEPFFTTKPEGRGLGLFLVRQFVDQVGGDLRIESASDEGTHVTLVLPASPRGGGRE